MKRLKERWDLSFTDMRYRAAVHIAFWLFFLFYWTGESVVLKVSFSQHYSVTLIGILLALFLYYPLVYGILPLFRRRRWLTGILCLMAYYFIAVSLRAYHIRQIIGWYNLGRTWIVGQDFWPQVIRNEFNPAELAKVLFSSIPSLAEIILIPLILKFIRSMYRSGQQQAWLARQNNELQLDALRAQLHPHFFFNTLNNLQSFIVHNEKDRSVALLGQLADLMRLSLYDCAAERVTMAQETALLTSYAAIEKVRFDENTHIEVRLNDRDPGYLIPSFLLLPFVENAFKHGGAVIAPHISVILDNAPESLRLRIRNRFLPGQAGGGIGLANARQRLAHYYAGKYRLDIATEKDWYQLDLELCKK